MYPHDPTAAFESWPAPTVTDATWDDVQAWHDGRCAMCGTRRQRIVEDHDHRTGLSRGLLCWSCNVMEGVTGHEAWARWKAGCNPAALLGVRREYPGRTYADDEWTAEDHARMVEAVHAIPAP